MARLGHQGLGAFIPRAGGVGLEPDRCFADPGQLWVNDPAQSDLLRYLLDRWHHPTLQVPESLATVRRPFDLEAVDKDGRRVLLRERGAELLTEAGATWEWLSSWLHRP